ncbi:MAG: tetratricopeptide repeat protein [Chloroflexi bacterium]|nr:tetratricopeptide repeat protein [Chloroflexota bacterium]
MSENNNESGESNTVSGHLSKKTVVKDNTPKKYKQKKPDISWLSDVYSIPDKELYANIKKIVDYYKNDEDFIQKINDPELYFQPFQRALSLSKVPHITQLIEEAKQASEKSSWEEALELLRQAKKETKDPELAAAITSEEVAILNSLGRGAEASDASLSVGRAYRSGYIIFGMNFIENDKFRSGLEVLVTVLSNDNAQMADRREAWFFLGRGCIFYGETLGKSRYLDFADEIFDTFNIVTDGRGVLDNILKAAETDYKTGRLPQAEHNYLRALAASEGKNEFKDKMFEIYKGLAIVYVQQEKYDVAEKYLLKAVSVDPENSWARNELDEIKSYRK